MSSSRVNRPTNLKQRDEDIQRKLQLYGIVNAFKIGKLPSNEQIDTTLNSFLASKALSSPSNKLSTEGRVLVSELREVISQAKYLVLSKNQGNLVQDFIWQTSRHDFKSITLPGSPVAKDAAKQDGDEALQGLKTLGRLLITNGQFRKLLNDALVFARDIAADGAAKATSSLRPSEEALANMDKAAEDNTWHEAPKFSKEQLKKQAQDAYKRVKPERSPKDAPQDSPADATEDIAGEAKEAAKAKSAEYRERAKAYYDQKMPQERKDQLIARLKKIVIECQQHPDYQKAIQTLLLLAEKYGGHAGTAGKNSSAAVQNARSQLSTAEANLKTLIERFANGTSTDGLWSSIGAFYTAADKDSELRSWFKSVDQFIRRALLQKGYILEEASTKEWNQLFDTGKFFLTNKYKPQTNRVLDEAKFFGEQFNKDPQNKAFATSLNKLFTSLGNDENGKPKFKPHLVKDLTYVVIPAALESISYIPIPRIEYSDPQIDAVIENLVLESDNFMPNMVQVLNNNNLSWGRKLAKVGKNKHFVQIKVSGIQMDLRNVSYYVKKKQGFPSITDIGIFSILMGGNGFSFQLGLSTADKHDPQHYFKVENVAVDIDYLKLTVHKSRHKLLFTLFKPILMNVLRPALQKILEKAVRDNFSKYDATLHQIKQDADRAGKIAEGDPDSPTPNSYKRFYNAAQKRLAEDKKKKQAQSAAKKSDNKKLNFAITQEDSIFPAIQLPGGFSNKATEFKKMSLQGNAWQSPVFAIGSAAPSKNIPAAPKIVLKKAMKATSTTSAADTATTAVATENTAPGPFEAGGIDFSSFSSAAASLMPNTLPFKSSNT